MLKKSSSYIYSLKEISEKELNIVGDKAVNLSKAFTNKINLPNSFIVSTLAFDDFLIYNDFVDEIHTVLADVQPFEYESAKQASGKIGGMIMEGEMPEQVKNSILGSYQSIGKPFVNIRLSNVIPEKFLTDLNENIVFRDIKGDEDLLSKVRQAWMSFFSTKAIELRVNNNYSGQLTMALLIQKDVRPEISGKIFSIPPITKEKDTLEFHAIYGVMEKDSDLDMNADIYKVDIEKEPKIIEKHIIPQQKMIVKKGKSSNSNSDDNKLHVEISKEWQRRQKLEDHVILDISKKTTVLEKDFKIPLEISWAVEGGTFYILGMRNLNLSEKFEDSDLLEEMNIVVKENKDKEVGNIRDEISKIVKNTKKSQLEIENYIKKDKKNNDIPKWSEDYNIDMDLILDISNLNSIYLKSFEVFDGTFLDGTELILEHKTLPEDSFDDNKKLNSMINSFAIEIATSAKNSKDDEFFYKFSDITRQDLDKLEYKGDGINYFGDERFIENPRSLAVEVSAVKTAKDDYKAENISICFPSVRSLKNLSDLKEIVSKIGLRRSKNAKYLVELAIPSLIQEFDHLEDGLIDGVIINYYKLLKLMIYRQEIRSVDHGIAESTIDTVIEKAKRKDLKVYVYLEETEDEVVKSLLTKKLDGIIFVELPKEETLK